MVPVPPVTVEDATPLADVQLAFCVATVMARAGGCVTVVVCVVVQFFESFIPMI